MNEEDFIYLCRAFSALLVLVPQTLSHIGVDFYLQRLPVRVEA